MTKPKKRIFKTILLSGIWLATVCVTVTLAIARRDEYGITSYLIAGAAAVMLAVFVVAHLPRRLQRRYVAELLGKLSVGLLILFAIFILAASLVKGYRNLGVLGTGVLILFLVTFVRIFISYVKDLNKEGRTVRREAENEHEPAG